MAGIKKSSTGVWNKVGRNGKKRDSVTNGIVSTAQKDLSGSWVTLMTVRRYDGRHVGKRVKPYELIKIGPADIPCYRFTRTGTDKFIIATRESVPSPFKKGKGTRSK